MFDTGCVDYLPRRSFATAPSANGEAEELSALRCSSRRRTWSSLARPRKHSNIDRMRVGVGCGYNFALAAERLSARLLNDDQVSNCSWEGLSTIVTGSPLAGTSGRNQRSIGLRFPPVFPIRNLEHEQATKFGLTINLTLPLSPSDCMSAAGRS